jgi:hypothetical protein
LRVRSLSPAAGQDLAGNERRHRQQQLRLKRAIDQTLEDLSALTTLAEATFSADIAAIFSGHHTLLDDPDLYAAACDIMRDEQCSAEWAWHQVLSDFSQQYRHLDDAYLQARYIDIEDILHRTLRHLNERDEALPQFSEPTIIIADDIFLPPSCSWMQSRSRGCACGRQRGSRRDYRPPGGIACCASRARPDAARWRERHPDMRRQTRYPRLTCPDLSAPEAASSGNSLNFQEPLCLNSFLISAPASSTM